MLREGAIQMIGPNKSAWRSPFVVFESFAKWGSLKDEKKLANGMYFAVMTTASKAKIDIIPNLFVQGYRPHSSGAVIHVQKRRYGEFVPAARGDKYNDDVVFDQVQLYQVKNDNNVELVLRDGECLNDKGETITVKQECRTTKGIQKLVDRICADNSFEVLGNLKQYYYHCPVSSGYFLALRSYHVWSVLIGVNTGFSFQKKVLVMEYYTGIPAVVDYDDRHFEKLMPVQICI